MVDCFWYPFDAFWILGAAWELFGRPVWDEALKDDQKELKMEALRPYWGQFGALWCSLGSPLG